VRFIISNIKPESCKFEQSFSTEGGKAQEVNWIAIDTRVNEWRVKKPAIGQG
jgi:hypothetical protein